MEREPNAYADLMPSDSPEWVRADQQKRETKRIQDEQETRRIQMKKGLTLG